MADSNVVTLDRGNNTTCNVNLHGATVVSWRVRNIEQLFLGRLSTFDDKRPIRGGVSILFPRYGHWKFGPKHGFARICPWKLESPPTRLKNNNIEAIFTFTDTEYTRSMWNYKFLITYKITLCEKELLFEISLKNMNENLGINYCLMLNNYIKTRDINDCSIYGLQYYDYIDKTKDNGMYQQEEEILKIHESTYRMYKNSSNQYTLAEPYMDRKLNIEKQNLEDTILWYPSYIEAKSIPYLWEMQHMNMLSMTFGCLFNPTKLCPGESYKACQKFQLLI